MSRKHLLSAIVACVATAAAYAESPKPTWELGRDAIDPRAIKGTVKLAGGAVVLDGTNAFSIPHTALGAQNDYTIEFEVKRAAEATNAKNRDTLLLLANTDAGAKAGLGLQYMPPDYNCAWLFCNGYRAEGPRGFLNEKFNKLTIVAKDRRLMLFRNGLLLMATDEIRPSTLPLTFGEVRPKPTAPYELRNIRIYDAAVFPSGFDATADRMRVYCGDQYAMQRVTIKDPALPRILIIGDSISMGYRGFITEHFRGKANIDYWVQGIVWVDGENSPGERALSGVLSNGPYDVVTFNFGLHWWPKPERLGSEKKFTADLTKIVEHLRKTAPRTRFIWIRTTPWRTTPAEGKPTLATEENQRIMRCNRIADEIMARHGIAEVDLYAVCEKQLDTVRPGSKDAVHWSPEVSKLMADEIIKEIAKALPERRPKGSP